MTGEVPEKAGTPERIDWNRLTQFENGMSDGRAVTRNLVRLFVETTRADLEELGTLLARNHREGLSRSLHRLKGGCSIIGAAAMARLAAEMETALTESGSQAYTQTPTTNPDPEKLREEFLATIAELRRNGFLD